MVRTWRATAALRSFTLFHSCTLIKAWTDTDNEQLFEPLLLSRRHRLIRFHISRGDGSNNLRRQKLENDLFENITGLQELFPIVKLKGKSIIFNKIENCREPRKNHFYHYFLILYGNNLAYIIIIMNEFFFLTVIFYE